MTDRSPKKELLVERTQTILAQLLRRPWSRVLDLVRAAVPDSSRDEQVAVTAAVKRSIEHVLNTVLQPRPGESGTPGLVDRLAFCWTILRRTETVVRKMAKTALPEKPLEVLAALIGEVLPQDLPVRDVFVRELSTFMLFEPDGSFLPHYNALKKIKRDILPIVDPDGQPLRANIRRVIWWLILRCRDEYVSPHSEGVEKRFPYLVHAVRKQLETIYSSEIAKMPGVLQEVEDQINRWLEYCCIEGPYSPTSAESQMDVARTFVKVFKLDEKVHISRAAEDPATERRIRELEGEVNRYADENKRLEEQLRAIEVRPAQALVASSPAPPPVRHPSESAAESGNVQSLYEALRSIDAKYSLDVLYAVQLGEEPQFGMKNLLSHLFYVLRKKGLVQYPVEETNHVHYDQSGLYDCSDFVIPPGRSACVTVVKSGWALKSDKRLFPIRKAIVRLAEALVAEEK